MYACMHACMYAFFLFIRYTLLCNHSATACLDRGHMSVGSLCLFFFFRLGGSKGPMSTDAGLIMNTPNMSSANRQLRRASPRVFVVFVLALGPFLRTQTHTRHQPWPSSAALPHLFRVMPGKPESFEYKTEYVGSTTTQKHEHHEHNHTHKSKTQANIM